MSLNEAPVLASVRNRIGHLTLNRPAGLNALTLPMVQIIHQHLRAWAEDEEIVAVILRATGEKAFCAGGDIRRLYDSFQNGDGELWAFFEQEYQLDLYIHRYPKPLLALMNGYVLGGGMGLAQGAALRVVSETARLGMPEVGIGYFPDAGGSYFLSRLPGNLGIYLGVTGQHVDASDALYAGLADHCLPRERFDTFLEQLDRQTWDTPVADCLARLIADMSVKLPEASLKLLAPAIEEHFAHNSIPAIRASLAAELRTDYRDWAHETLQLIDSRSPLAVSVTLELLRRGRERSLAECFAMELHLDRLWFEHGNILEGIRALLVDKDNAPRWNPPTLDQISPQQIEAFFRGL